MKVQECSRATGAGDDPVGLLEDSEDVVAFHGFQAGLSLVGGWLRHRQKVVGRCGFLAFCGEIPGTLQRGDSSRW